MLLAANLTLLECVLLATILVCGGGFLWRTLSRPMPNVSAMETEENERAQARAEGRIAQLEVRLHDFAREVEARMETRALHLDRLVVEGDREIVRLSTLLNQMPDNLSTRQPDVTHFDELQGRATFPKSTAPESKAEGSSISAAQVEMIGHLNEAGYNVSEIAHIIGHAPDVVHSVLKRAA
jgi:hypothetical protein